ncbi:MAG: MBL fold metallo-hydrolase [Deltaproteobacteria bacterium]|nr:MBL fold metallo-hydrolase [Deltaproteobacteria bacterium]
MLLHSIAVTMFMTNCFILADEETNDAIIIDPGGEEERIFQMINNMGVNIVGIVNTHAHVDHIGALSAIKDAYDAEIMLHQLELPILRNSSKMGRLFGVEIEQPPEPDRFLAEGDQVVFGKTKLRVVETPGHSPGGISLVTSDNTFCFAGDTLFAGSIGRTDLPGGDYRTLIDSIKTKLIPLGDEMKVLPGHGPATSIGVERKHNPFL